MARLDKSRFPDIITAGGAEPYYTNSTQIPVGYTDDIFEVVRLQDKLQSMYTGGTVLHLYLGERITDRETCKNLSLQHLVCAQSMVTSQASISLVHTVAKKRKFGREWWVTLDV